MQIRQEIQDLVEALGDHSPGHGSRLTEAELSQLADVVGLHPELWPVGLADMFQLLHRRLRLEEIDRSQVPDPLLAFFDAKFRKDLDVMALAREIGRDICGSCSDCGCRC